MTTAIDPIANIPAELQSLPRFVLWRMESQHQGDDPTKIPYSPRTLRRASSTDPATWASFAIARAALARHRQRFNGIMFALHEDAPYFGIDLDDCRDPDTGAIDPRARGIIDRFDTFTEISQSRCGVKMIGRGIMPTPDGAGKNYRRDPWGTGTGGIEMYRRGRFFALTGNRVDGTPATVEERSSKLASLYRELYPPTPRPLPRPIRGGAMVADADAVRRCLAYVARLPASVAGQGGHDRLLHAACVVLRFGLSDADALNVLAEYNARAVPPWGERDIARKLAEAHKRIGPDFGAMLADRTPDRPTPRRPHWRIMATIGGAA